MQASISLPEFSKHFCDALGLQASSQQLIDCLSSKGDLGDIFCALHKQEKI